MITERLGLDGSSFVVELASNDGYLLQYFVERGHPVPRDRTGGQRRRGGRRAGRADRRLLLRARDRAPRCADAGQLADLVLGNNVLAQVPDLNDFVAGIPIILKPGGTVTIEFPHVMRMLDENQFDTIYHEHFCYFSLTSAEAIFAGHGMTIFDVEELWTHGGSLRIYARHADETDRASATGVARAAGPRGGAPASATSRRTSASRSRCGRPSGRCSSCSSASSERARRSSATARPGKGNTLLNYCGIRTDFVDFTVDRNPYKQGRFLPGTHIPIHPPERLDEARPDYVLILPWNFKDEILAQLAHAREWGAQFIVPIPDGRRCSDVLGARARSRRVRPLRLLCLGAHSDDIEIGCGGTVLRLLAEHPGAHVTGSCCRPPPNASRRRGPAPPTSLPTPARRRGGRRLPRELLPVRRRRHQGLLQRPPAAIEPDVVFCHHRSDEHQDHRTVPSWCGTRSATTWSWSTRSPSTRAISATPTSSSR